MRKAFAEGVVCRPGERFFGESDAVAHKQWFRLAFIMVPKDELEHLQVREGEAVYLTRVPGGIQLTGHDPAFEAGMKAFDRTRRKFRNAFRELAK